MSNAPPETSDIPILSLAFCNPPDKMSSKGNYRNTKTHDLENDDLQLSQDEPPPYEVHSSGPVLSSSFAINGIDS